MCRKLFIIFLLCVAMLFSSIVSAQESIWSKQKIAIASISDRTERGLDENYKRSIYNKIRDVLVTNFYPFEVNIDDVKNQLRASNLPPSTQNIRKKIGERGADFIVFTEIRATSSAYDAYNANAQIIIVLSQHRIATGKEVSRTITVSPTRSAITDGVGQLISELFGVSTSGQSASQNTCGSQPAQSTHQSFNSNFSSQNSSPQVFVENANYGLNMKMIYVEGGTFQMGATTEQASEADSDESPVHSVTVGSFYMAECEVTQAQWQKIMGTTIYQQRDKANSSWSMYGVGDTYPMYYVNWEEANQFCQELSAMTGRRYRLPTEAEWEYAARGGNRKVGTKYSGGGVMDAVGWYDGNSGNATHPVKQKRANALGLYDMSGNVWEWCSDWYGDYSSSSQNNPTGPSSGQNRVLRGGSWCDFARRCRVSRRNLNSPSNRNCNLGFRVVCLP